MFAIIDIETCGGKFEFRKGHVIEICILIHDGLSVVDKFSTLINNGDWQNKHGGVWKICKVEKIRVICLNQHICCSGSPEHVAKDPAFIHLFGEAASSMAMYHHTHDHEHD